MNAGPSRIWPRAVFATAVIGIVLALAAAAPADAAPIREAAATLVTLRG